VMELSSGHPKMRALSAELLQIVKHILRFRNLGCSSPLAPYNKDAPGTTILQNRRYRGLTSIFTLKTPPFTTKGGFLSVIE